MTVHTDTVGPLAISTRWLRVNLFSNRWNTMLTIVTVTVAAFVIFSLGQFVFVSANWESVEVNRRLLAIATYPKGEEWRLWPPLVLLGLSAGLAYGLWSRVTRRAIVIGVLTSRFLFAFISAVIAG